MGAILIYEYMRMIRIGRKRTMKRALCRRHRDMYEPPYDTTLRKMGKKSAVDLSESTALREGGLGAFPFNLRCRFVIAADGVVNFFAVNAHFFWSVDPEANLVPADVHDGHLDIVTDHDCLVTLTA